MTEKRDDVGLPDDLLAPEDSRVDAPNDEGGSGDVEADAHLGPTPPG